MQNTPELTFFSNIKYSQPTNGLSLNNLWLTQANALGLKLDRFADSTGEVGQLLA